MTPEIKFLVITNSVAVCVFILQIGIKTVLKIIARNKEELTENKEEVLELKVRLKVIQENTEKIPEIMKDLNEAHIKIRHIEKLLNKKGE